MDHLVKAHIHQGLSLSFSTVVVMPFPLLFILSIIQLDSSLLLFFPEITLDPCGDHVQKRVK